MTTDADTRIADTLALLFRHGGTNEVHHLRWVVDQVARKLTGGGEAYDAWVKDYREADPATGEEQYEWDVGVPP